MSPSFVFLKYSTESDHFFIAGRIRLAYSIENMLYANLKGWSTMITTQEIMEQLAGKGIVQELTTYLKQTFEDFADVQGRYMRAVEQLKEELREEESPSVDDLVDAIKRQTASNLFFSGILGIKANLDHFIDPMARTILDVDFDVFLRENTARRLPEYEKAQGVIDSFCATLSLEQKEVFVDILEYISYLETIGPKIAHFYGFVLGDEILYRIVPGYHSDNVLTIQYKAMMDSLCYALL